MIMPIADSFLSDFAFIFSVAGLGFFALLVALPTGKWIARRLEAWPKRPMNNGERKAKWACKYYQATPIMPNSHPWPWVKPIDKGSDVAYFWVRLDLDKSEDW